MYTTFYKKEERVKKIQRKLVCTITKVGAVFLSSACCKEEFEVAQFHRPLVTSLQNN